MEYWARLRGPESYPRINQFDVEAVPGFGPHAFMLDLGHDPEDPLVRHLGQGLSAESAKTGAGRKLSEVPHGSLLARVASRYREVLDSKGPLEFEYEYASGPDRITLCRGLLLPFTAGGKTIDYIVGAVTSRVVEVDGPQAGAEPPARDGPARAQDARGLLAVVETEVSRGEARDKSPDTLRQSLRDCRTAVRRLAVANTRSHKALYAALERVYAFHFQAEDDPAAFEQLIAAAGLKSQARAPFIPVVKLAFGSGYEKTRLSEYAAALSYAKRCGRTPTDFKSFLESQQGGLKGCVRAERAARRAAGTNSQDTTEHAKELLRTLDSLGLITDLEGGAEGFVLILGRRSARRPGVVEVLRILDERPSAVDAAAGRAARAISRETQGRPGARQEIPAGPPSRSEISRN